MLSTIKLYVFPLIYDAFSRYIKPRKGPNKYTERLVFHTKHQQKVLCLQHKVVHWQKYVCEMNTPVRWLNTPCSEGNTMIRVFVCYVI